MSDLRSYEECVKQAEERVKQLYDAYSQTSDAWRQASEARAEPPYTEVYQLGKLYGAACAERDIMRRAAHVRAQRQQQAQVGADIATREAGGQAGITDKRK
jgi:hypothetical protein